MASPNIAKSANASSFNVGPKPTPELPTKEECIKVCPECGATVEKKSTNQNTPVSPGPMAPSPSTPQNSLGPESPIEPPKSLFGRIKGFFGLGGRRRKTRGMRDRRRKGTRKHRRGKGSRKH